MLSTVLHSLGRSFDIYQALLSKNAKVYVAARNKDKAEAAITQLKEETGREALFLELNLGDLASVRTSASMFLSQEERLHVLFQNASVPHLRPCTVSLTETPMFRGVMWPPHELLTKDGYDLQFGTNVIVSPLVRAHPLLLTTCRATSFSCSFSSQRLPLPLPARPPILRAS
jgi:retinol dehydrogenase-12